MEESRDCVFNFYLIYTLHDLPLYLERERPNADPIFRTGMCVYVRGAYTEIYSLFWYEDTIAASYAYLHLIWLSSCSLPLRDRWCRALATR